MIIRESDIEVYILSRGHTVKKFMTYTLAESINHENNEAGGDETDEDDT